MEKRVFVAILLSIIVLMVYFSFIAKITPPPATTPHEAIVPATQQGSPEVQVAPQISPGPTLSYTETETDKYQVKFALPLATIWEAVIKDYNHASLLKNGLFCQFDKELFFKPLPLEQGAVFIAQDQEKAIIKRFNFDKSNYSIELELKVRNLTNHSLTIPYKIILGTIKLDDRFLELLTFNPRNMLIRIGLGRMKKDLNLSNPLQTIGLRDRYFCILMKSSTPGYGFVQRITEQEALIGMKLDNLQLTAQQEVTEKFLIYFGPQKANLLNNVQSDWGEIVNFGFFDPISKIILQLVQIIRKITFNWGLAIIGLSILIFILLYPFTLKQLRSLKDMQAIQPQIETLRKQCKDNPQKLNKEITELYKKHKINPFSGCLTMVLQIPIFFALYQALMRSLDLRGAKFLWIKDLSEPDRALILPTRLPVIANEINILPILMAITMFFQQKISMKTSGAQSLEQQRLMLVLMPVMFGFLFYHFPSGLGLYWFVYSLLSLLFQWRIARTVRIE